MPRKWVEERDPSPDARCGRWDAFLEGYCAAPVQLVFTRNPMTDLPYQELVIQRCTAGHCHRVTPVEVDLNVFAEDDDTGAIGL